MKTKEEIEELLSVAKSSARDFAELYCDAHLHSSIADERAAFIDYAYNAGRVAALREVLR